MKAKNVMFRDRDKKELAKGIFVRCRNTSIPRLSEEFHDIEISIVLNRKIMARSNHVVEDLEINEKIDRYCAMNKIKRESLNIRHISGATEFSNEMLYSKETIDAVYDILLMKGTMPQKEYFAKLQEATSKIK